MRGALTVRGLALAAAAALALAACGSSDDEEPSAEEQIRTVGRSAAEAVASRDGGKLCEVTDTSELEQQVRGSGRKDLVKLLDEDGAQAVCAKLAEAALFDDQSAEEKADAESFEIVSVKIEGDEATAEVRTQDDETDATFKRVDGEWKFVQSTALE